MTKEIKEAIMDNLRYWVYVRNYGSCSTKINIRQEIILRDNKIKIDHKNGIITQNGKPILKIERRFSAHKSKVYLHNKELTPELLPIKEWYNDFYIMFVNTSACNFGGIK